MLNSLQLSGGQAASSLTPEFNPLNSRSKAYEKTHTINCLNHSDRCGLPSRSRERPGPAAATARTSWSTYNQTRNQTRRVAAIARHCTPAATATNPAIRAYSMRSCPLLSFQIFNFNMKFFIFLNLLFPLRASRRSPSLNQNYHRTSFIRIRRTA